MQYAATGASGCNGAVRCGDFIGPKADGSGLGVVTSLAAGPVIGIALGAKEGPAAGAVKTLCFAGFNALTPLGADFKRLFAQARTPGAAYMSHICMLLHAITNLLYAYIVFSRAHFNIKLLRRPAAGPPQARRRPAAGGAHTTLVAL